MATAQSANTRDYCIRSDEPLGAEVRRAAIGRLDDALERLAGVAANPDKAVHETRKDIKRVRSALRLARDGIGAPAYIRENTLFRAAGQLLGPARDAAIKIETLDAEHGAFDVDDDLLRAWRDLFVQEKNLQLVRLLDELTDEVTAIIETGRAGVCDWPHREIDWGVIGTGFGRIFETGRTRLEAVLADPAPKHLHAWRRRAKDLRHQLELLCECRPGLAAQRLDRAHELTDLLGDHQNLAVLSADAATRESVLGPSGIEAVRDALAPRMAALASNAIAVGRPLYEEQLTL